MQKRVLTACLVSSLAVVATCGGDSAEPIGFETIPTSPISPITSITIDGPTLVMVGANARLAAVGHSAAGESTPSGVSWKSSAPEIATIDSDGLVHGVAIGTTVISATIRSTSASLAMTSGNWPAAPLTLKLGDTLVDVMRKGVGINKFAITLAAGDTFDLAAAKGQTDNLRLDGIQIRSLVPGFKLTSSPALSSYGMYVAQVAPFSGTYEFAATLSNDGRDSRGILHDTGSYVIRARRAGAVLNVVRMADGGHISQGNVLAETTWVQNLGARAATVTMSTTTPWLSVAPGSATIPGGSTLPYGFGSFGPDTIPADAVPFVFRIDARALSRGEGYAGEFSIGAPQSVWQVSVPPTHGVNIRVDDSTVRVLGQSTSIGILATGPGNELFGTTLGAISKIDLQSGMPTVWQAMPNVAVLHLDFTPDGTAYVTTSSLVGDAILKISPNGARSTLVAFDDKEIRGTAVMPDGRLFTLHGPFLLRRDTDGTSVILTTTSVISRNLTNLVFNPVDGGLYYSVNRILHRVDPSTGADEARGGPQEGDLDTPILAVDGSGRLYTRTFDAAGDHILVLDTAGHVVDRLYAPPVFGLSVVGDVLYGSSGGALWRMPIRY